jgi:hypothetical protein
MTLPPLAWTLVIVAGVLLVLMVAGIAIQIAILQDSRGHIQAQDAKASLLLRQARAAAPATRDAVPLIRDARPLVRKLSSAIGPLMGSGSSLAETTQRLPTLVRTVQVLAGTALPVLADVARANVSRALSAGTSVAKGVLYRDRLTRALDATNDLLAEVRAADLVDVTAEAGRDTPRLMRRLLRIQLVTLEVQKRSLETQLATLDIQRQALVHIESIDRKTGGPVPPTATPAP